MNVVSARVLEVEALPGPYCLLWFEAPAITRQARPGQFVMAQCGEGRDPFLPRPFALGRSRAAAPGAPPAASLLVSAVGPGSDWLARRRPGDAITLCGPLGRAITLRPGVRNLLLAGSGMHIAALLAPADAALAAGCAVTLVTGPGRGGPAFPPGLLPAEVEVVLHTAGDDAALAALAPHLRWADETLVCAAEPLLRSLAGELRRQQLRKPVLAVCWQPLACGTGLGTCCPVETRRRGVKLFCRDGPWFELNELY